MEVQEEVFDTVQALANTNKQYNAIMPMQDAVFDVGNLCVYSYEVPPGEAQKDTITRCIQGLVAKVFSLPIEKTNVGPLVLLPISTTPIPREKSVPVEAPPTRWEKFASAKGITKKEKNNRKVWDQATGRWRHTWSRDSVKNQKEWLMEANPKQIEGFEDPFIKKATKRKEQIDKQKKREASNERRALISKTKELVGSDTASMVIGSMAPTAKPVSKERLAHAIKLMQTSTRSLGNHDVHLRDEPRIKKRKIIPQDKEAEKLTSMRMLKKVVRKDKENNQIDKNKMANQAIHAEHIARHKRKQSTDEARAALKKRKTRR